MTLRLPERPVPDTTAPSSPLAAPGTVLVILRQDRAGQPIRAIAAAVGLDEAIVRAIVTSPLAAALRHWTETDVH